MSLGGWLEDDLEPEGGAPAGVAGDGDRASHQLAQLLRDGEPEAGPPEAAGGGAVGLVERPEEPLGVHRGDADARVPDLEREPGGVVGGVRHRDPDRDLALLGELDRVGEEVEEDLAEAPLVSPHGVWRAGLHEPRDLESLPPGLLGDELDRALDELLEVEVDGIELQLARLDLREVEDVVDDRQERGPGAVGGLGVVVLRRGELGAEEELDHAEDPVEGGADLVAHVGEELGLEPHRLVGALLLVAEAGVGAPQLGRSLGDRGLEGLPVLPELAVPSLHLLEHLVEGLGEVAELVVALGPGPDRVVALPGDPLGGLDEVEDRPREDALEGDRHQEADEGRHHRDPEGDPALPHHVGTEVVEPPAEHDRAQALAVVHDGSLDPEHAVDVARAARETRERTAGRLLRSARCGGVRREDALVGQVEARRADLGLGAQGDEELPGGPGILEGEGGSAVEAHHVRHRLHLAGGGDAVLADREAEEREAGHEDAHGGERREDHDQLAGHGEIAEPVHDGSSGKEPAGGPGRIVSASSRMAEGKNRRAASAASRLIRKRIVSESR